MVVPPESNIQAIAKKIFPYILIAFLSIVFFHSILDSSKTLNNIHYINDMTFESEHVRKFLHEGQGLPLWTPYFYAGQPYLAVPEHYLFDLNFLYVLFLNDVVLAMNLAAISYLFVAGAGMYLLLLGFIKKPLPALCAAIIYMFNGFVTGFILSGHLNLLEGYALIPFAVLFIHKSLSEEYWALHSTGAGIVLGLMVLSGSIIFLLYAVLIIAVFSLCMAIGRNVTQGIVRTVKVGALVSVVLLGVCAIKLFPTLEFTSMSSRSGGVSYQEYLGNPIQSSNLLNVIGNVRAQGFTAAVGISGIILTAFGLVSIKKKAVAFSSLLFIIGVLLATGSFLAEWFFYLPGFSQMRHIERALVLIAFAVPVMAAYGASILQRSIGAKLQTPREALIGVAMVLVVAIELLGFRAWPHSVDVVDPMSIPIIAKVSEDKGVYRVASHSLETPIGASGYNYYVQLEIPEVKGGGGIWMPEYVQYLAFAQAQDPATLFGVLGAKYIISKKELDYEGLVLKEKFLDCENCAIWEAYGPYLYENEFALPSAFTTDGSVLLVGSERAKRDASYVMLARKGPLIASIVMGRERIGDYPLEELKKYGALILLENSVSPSDGPKLEKYVQQGGIILPNILKGESGVSQDQIELLLGEISGEMEGGAESSRLSFNSFSVEVTQPKKWLVLSERIAYFPGWKAVLGGEELQIEKVNGVISAVYLGGKTGTIEFSYMPQSFKKGAITTLITLIGLTVFLVLSIWKRKKKISGKAAESERMNGNENK